VVFVWELQRFAAVDYLKIDDELVKSGCADQLHAAEYRDWN